VAFPGADCPMQPETDIVTASIVISKRKRGNLIFFLWQKGF
jgi:hypothetical protein